MAMIQIDPRDMKSSERAEARALVEAVNADARANFHRSEFREAFAQQAAEEIYMGFDHENLLSEMAVVENVGWGDPSPTVSETRGLRAFWLANNGYVEMSSVHTETFEIPRARVAFHVSDTVNKFKANFSLSQQELITLGTQRMDAVVNSSALKLFQAAIDSSSDYYVSASGLTLNMIDDAIAAVQDSSLLRDVTIVGRFSMTQQIPNLLTGSNGSYPAFIPATNEEILRTGLLGTYKGAKIISLTNYKDDNNVSFFPGNELYVIAPDASKFAFWGGLSASEWIEPDNGYWHFQAEREFGGLIHRPDRVRRIVDSNTSPV